VEIDSQKMKIKLTALCATICFAALLVASTYAQTPRIIGFPTLDLDADIVEFDLASQTSKSLIVRSELFHLYFVTVTKYRLPCAEEHSCQYLR
jgi:hypothetical protein